MALNLLMLVNYREAECCALLQGTQRPWKHFTEFKGYRVMASWQAWKNRFCTALFLGVVSTQAAFAIPVLSVTSTPSPAVKGSTVSVDVRIADVADLYGYQYSLSFNAAVLQATSITEGAFLATGGSTFFGPGTISNTLGSIKFTYDTLVGNVPGANGSGVLARINFNVLNAGTSTLAFSDVSFINSSLTDITLQVQNGSLLAVQAVPEPATLVMLCLGLAGLAASRYRQRG